MARHISLSPYGAYGGRSTTQEPSPGVLRALAEELDVSLDYLAGLSDAIELR